MLWRLDYLREKIPVAVMFSAPGIVEASKFKKLWQATAKVEKMNLSHVGLSRFVKLYGRRTGLRNDPAAHSHDLAGMTAREAIS